MVRVSGELDIDRAPQLRTTLRGALTDTDGGDIVVDLSGVEFCDSTGLNVLLQARLEAEEKGRAVCLAGPRPQMRQLLELTGAHVLFPVVPLPGRE
ncbi:hypothetical protein AMK16_01755 [Streptomyces sp. CB00455]|nr:hypothetical protein AMK16_01755 [Streptomyces sp. CB00455]